MRIFSKAIILAGLTIPSLAMAAQDIPVKRVVMSTSGLAYFEHSAKVSGNETLSFPVRLDQVNDLLKSLLVFDSKGQLKSVRLPGKQPLEQAFRDLPFTHAQLNNPVALLNAYQGANVQVKDAGQTHQGQLVQVKAEKHVVDETAVKKHRVTLLTKQGLKSFLLEDLQSVELLDGKATAEIQSALDAVFENGQSERRKLQIDLTGQDTRNVALSYVVSAPLWKTSYRLVLPKTPKKNGHMQGWAIIENMTGGDWDNVNLSLTSGNPVTLQQDLYPSYYVDRPSIPVEVFGRVMPRMDKGAMPMLQKEQKQQRMELGKASRGAGFSGNLMAMDSIAEESVMAMPMPASPQATLSNMVSAKQAAQSSDTTAQILFEFPGDFNLDSGQSMMLPFVDQGLPMETVALYQPDRHGEHPFLSVSIDNTGKSSLPPGILTIYEDGDNGLRFVGDAQLDMLPKSEKRMVSYALDGRTKIDREYKNGQTVVQMTASGGVLKKSVKYRNETTYSIKAPAEDDRLVVLEHPRMGGYDLTSHNEKDVDMTNSHYRIKVPVKAGETVKHTVTLERTGWESIRIDSMSLYDLKAYASNRGKMDDATRKLFASLAEKRQAMSDIEQQIRDLESKRRNIYNDQNRIRENIKSLSGSSSLKNRYLEQLDDQEDKLEDIQEDIDEANEKLADLRKDLQDYVRKVKF